jgi:hypothetical protein
VNRQLLRVCTDPANMPFCNDKGEGFDSKIAEIVGEELKIPVEYTYFPQATGFLRNTLFAKRCDLVMEAGQGDPSLLNTNAIYTSAYVLLYKPNHGLDGVNSLFDPRLKAWWRRCRRALGSDRRLFRKQGWGEAYHGSAHQGREGRPHGVPHHHGRASGR